MKLAYLKSALAISASAVAMIAASDALCQTESPILAASASAATAAETPPSPPGFGLGFGVDEVVVTARRRTESAQKVPIALSVLSSDALERTGTYNVIQVTQLVPSVQVLSTNPRNTAITIRGLGASYGLANDGLEQGAGIYIDQVYNARPATATFDFVDIDRVEVLRGPQGTLFGKNTTAGALNITTRGPTFTPEAQGEVSFGNYNFYQGKAAVSGPLYGDVVAGRFSVVATRRDGLLDNVTVHQKQNEQKNVALRGELQFNLNPKAKLRLFADYSRQEPICCTQVYVTYGQTLKPAAQQFPALAAGRNYTPGSRNPYDRLADVDSPIRASQTLEGVAAIIDYDLDFATLTSVTAYRDWKWEPANDRDYTALDIVRQSANPSWQNQTSQELRLASNGQHTIDWVGGVYYFKQNVTTKGVTEYGRDASYWLLPTTNSPAGLLDGYTVFNNSSIDTTSYAAFGQFTWNATSKFRVTPGLRYTYEKKSGNYEALTQGGAATTDSTLLTRRLGIARPQAYDARISGGSLSGQIALSYDLTSDVHSYATFARGYKSGGINMAGLPTTAAGLPALTSAVVRPEKVTTYEVGLKTQLLDRLLTANVAAYYTTVHDFQANVVDSGPGALRGYLANIEKVTIKGAEFDLTTRSIHGFTGYANLAWTDGEYSSFKNGPCPLERIGTSTAACDLSGRELPGVSRWAGSAGIEYRRPISIGAFDGDFYTGFDASYRSAYYADASTSNYARIKAYTVSNLRVGFKSSGKWEAFVFVKNLFNEDYLQLLTVQTGNSGLITGTPGDQRTFGVTLRARY
jgi:iron complex outermembrane recepter protein